MKKYIKIVWVILLIFSSCSNDINIGLEDLDFADVEREYIAENKIFAMYLISDNYDKNVDNDRFSDTFMCYTYDTQGRLQTETDIKWWGYVSMLGYDSIGLVKIKLYRTDFMARFYPTYKYIQEDRKLYQYWVGNSTDTCFFIFDKKGRIIESEEYTHNDYGSGRYFKSTYSYNSDGKLQNKTEIMLIHREDLSYFVEWITKDWRDAEYWLKKNPMSKSTEYYYTNGKIDSTITAYSFFKPEWDYTSKTYYDNKGLRVKTVEKDSLKYHYEYVTIGEKVNNAFFDNPTMSTGAYSF